MKKGIRILAALLAVCILCLPACKKEDNRTQIWTAQELRQMKDSGSYVLMADIDLGGEHWQPIHFQGQLDGNGKKISNFTLEEAVDGNVGLFAVLEGSVTNLHLENVTLAAENAQAAGMLAGTSKGRIEGCTVTGTISDDRTDSCVGVFVGRNQGALLGGGELLTATAGSANPEDIATGLSAKIKLSLPEDRIIGLTGEGSVEQVDTGMIWQDASADFENLPEQEQQRRLAVESKMRQMGTVRWTTSEEISYTVNDNRQSASSNVFLPGRTYVGLPYSVCEGSFERFLTQMQAETDSEGRFVTVSGLEDGVKTKSDAVSGFVTAMGNDCVGAVIWALAAAVPFSVEEGGMAFLSPLEMVPNQYNVENFGALPAGGYTMIESDQEKYPTGLDARDTTTIISLNGGAVEMAEYYQKAYRGDFLLCLNYTYDAATDTWKKTSNHGRMLSYEPMIIRGWNGKINLESSYVITHEQGDGLYDNRMQNGQYETYRGYNLKNTSWRTDYKYSLYLLLTKEGYNAGYLPGTGYGYIPVTVGMYTRQDPVEFTCRQVAPQVYESNYLMTHATMTVTDDSGTVYEKTAYLPYRVFSDFAKLDLAELFPDAAKNLTQGKTYRKRVVAYTTGGMECTVIDENFTH